MLKFIAFFRRFRVFLVFLFFQVVALSSYFSVMSFPRTKFFNSSSAIVATLLSWERDVVKYLYLDEANRKLQAENALLEKRIQDNFISIDSSTAKINDTLNKLSFEHIPATVINSSHDYANNYFTIDAGSEKGIQKKMGVVSSDGIVGIVYDVSKSFAIVKSILTKDINISASIDDSYAHGLIKFDAKDPRNVMLTGFSNDIEVEIGSKVMARGSGGYFPQGEPIGLVKKVEPVEGKPMWDITVELHQDMRKLRYVYVIKNIHQLELNNLEKDIEQLQ
ncbi:rod shape-determining protein MreC [Brumimicrobium aurantiacum]|uniref:Cell shape-determining protein MreC n=1 Tax=Brumimicrobium aurantiacum TaxID=1737063 RepID=A0A3E1EX51_9FLAO|nr:rod shape-determining protein MreC [Brumimicrobium aurantiacum]RFC54140.1 rod shape-determining protein MreC [Brumimicrobium aurantiacum]